MEEHLLHHTYLVGETSTVADVTVVSYLAPLFESVIGTDARSKFPAVTRWFSTCSQLPAFAKVLGNVKLSDKAGDWAAPQPATPKKDKKKKEGAEASKAVENGNSPKTGAAENGDDEDPEKKAKKAAKAAEKEAKKAKAAAKAEAKKVEDKGANVNEKKAKAKAEAEAKKLGEAEEVAKLIAAAKATPAGSKKDTSGEMPKAYHPKFVEAAWYEWWEQCGFFKPDPKSTKPAFTIVIPPPNVTGALHIGHALTNSIEDTVVRWRRMSGYNTLWVPGTDHAGIATQTVVEKKLQRERGVTRHELGRENFLKEVYQWVEQYGNKIFVQLRRLGSSVDWSRSVFTMDEKRSAAVLEAFVRMYEQGCIYRDNRLVNWCCRLKTAVSDIEVDYIDIPKRTQMSVPGYDHPVEFGVLTSFAYPLEDGSDEIVVATTRPETMLGDTAVAVHPEDPRYTAMHGKFVIHPVSKRRIPIICDADLVDMSFGTGAVKVTPAHDPNDFVTGKTHNLEFINIFDDNGLINEHGGPFKGQPRFKCRVTIVDFLQQSGLFRGTADNPMRLGLCSRSKDVIEPILKPQWWVSCKDMAARSCQIVRDGQLAIVPKEFEAVWFRWLENIRDWCISRQLWWGHRIPAYYVIFEGEGEAQSGNPGMPSENMGRWVVGRTLQEAQVAAANKYPGKKCKLVQDEDVLDTWFSSGLFPFSVFNWPENTEDLKVFYPTALLETGHDILFFWVARMVMMGLQLTGQPPFNTVFLHAMIRDAHGRKMTKSLGNVIDPTHVIEGISLDGLHATLLGGNLDPKEVERAQAGQKTDFPEGIDECGADALRFALVAYTSQARDINLDIKRVVAYRHWCNKLWNAIRFAMMNLPPGFKPLAPEEIQVSTLPPASQWILSRLSNATQAITKALDDYLFHEATQRLYAFWQYDLCDVFIELMKPVMALDEAATPGAAALKAATRASLWTCLDWGLRLLHPFMPFVTEELWQRLPKTAEQSSIASIMLAPYPAPIASWQQPNLERDLDYLLKVVGRIRNLRTDYGLVKQKPQVYLVCADAARSTVLSELSKDIATLTSSSEVCVCPASAVPTGCGVVIVDDVTTVSMLLKGILDPDLELEKLEKKCAEVAGRLELLNKKMATQSYIDKTPDNIKAEDQERVSKAEAELANTRKAQQDMAALKAACQ